MDKKSIISRMLKKKSRIVKSVVKKVLPYTIRSEMGHEEIKTIFLHRTSTVMDREGIR